MVSTWRKINDPGVDISEDGQTIEVLFESDKMGNNYFEINVDHIKRLIKDWEDE